MTFQENEPFRKDEVVRDYEDCKHDLIGKPLVMRLNKPQPDSQHLINNYSIVQSSHDIQ